MLVADLIQQLKELPQSLEVFAAIDEEGNGFNKIHCVQVDKMDEFDDVYHPDDYEEHADDLREVVCLW